MRIDIKTAVSVVDGVTVTVDGMTVTMKGPKGELTRTFRIKGIKITVENNEVVITALQATRREKVSVFTTEAHIKNMIKGVAEGYEYKLKICAGHFPMSVKVENDALVVKNFIGEVSPRKLKLKEGAKVNIDGEIITVNSVDKEIAGQVAGDIEKMCKRPAFDNRIFQDGIYIISKAGKEIM
jgi:large subunit ribosomal protein L6